MANHQRITKMNVNIERKKCDSWMNLSDKGELNNIAGISRDFSMDVTNSVMEFDDFS